RFRGTLRRVCGRPSHCVAQRGRQTTGREIAVIDATSNVPLGDGAKPKWHSHWRLLAVLLGGAVLAAGIGLGWWVWLPTRMPDPPVADLAGAEPVVAEAIGAARAALVGNLRSATAWGHLGMVLQAHDYVPEAQRCFAQAEKLDAADPRWPYLQARTLLK